MRRYRDALNYSVRAIIANKALSLSRAHRLLYKDLRERYGLPSRARPGLLQGGHRYSQVLA